MLSRGKGRSRQTCSAKFFVTIGDTSDRRPTSLIGVRGGKDGTVSEEGTPSDTDETELASSKSYSDEASDCATLGLYGGIGPGIYEETGGESCGDEVEIGEDAAVTGKGRMGEDADADADADV